jgi:hypothetical protein
MQKKAFSLALTLWIVAILSLLSAYYLNYGKKVVKKSRELQIKLHLVLEAESMVELIKFYGSTGVIVENRIENRLLKEKIKKFPNILFIDSRKMVWDNSTIVLQDAAGLIDINDKIMIADYMAEDKEKKAIIEDSMSDWYDYDDYSSLNGAENSYYSEHGRIADVRNEHYFAAAEELFLIRGLDHLSKLQQKKLLSNFILSDGGGRYNFFTLKDEILKSRYSLTSNDMEQLKKAKEKGLEAFKNTFYTLNKRESMSFEEDGIYPSSILRGYVITSFKNIREKIEFVIDFNVKSEEKVFEVLYYKN